MKVDPHIKFILACALIIIFIIMFFIGCKPSLETCNRLYPPQEKEITKDSVVYQKETVIIPGDTTYIAFPFTCVEDSLKHVIEIFRGRMGKYDMQLKYTNGQLLLWQKRYNDSITSFSKFEQKKEVKIEKIPYQVDKPYIPKVFWIIFIIASVIITVWVVKLFK